MRKNDNTYGKTTIPEFKFNGYTYRRNSNRNNSKKKITKNSANPEKNTVKS